LLPSLPSSSSIYQSPSLKYLDSPDTISLPPKKSTLKTLTQIIPTPEIRDPSLEKNASFRGTNLITYIERHTAALEKLNERIGKQKEEQNERKDSKTYNNAVHRSIMLPETEMKAQKDILEEVPIIKMKKISSEKRPTIKITREVRRRKTNALEALGQLYLMGKLPNPASENSILNNRSSLLAFIEEEFAEKINDQPESLIREKEEEKEQKQEEEKYYEEEPLDLSERKSTKPCDSRKEGVDPRQRRYLQVRRQLLDIPRQDQSYNDSKNDILSERSGITSTSKSKSKIKLPSDEGENEEEENKPKKAKIIKKPRKSKRNLESPLKCNDIKKSKEYKK